MEETNASKEVCAEVWAKITEYGNISRRYGIMLDDTFTVTWYAEVVFGNTSFARMQTKLSFGL